MCYVICHLPLSLHIILISYTVSKHFIGFMLPISESSLTPISLLENMLGSYCLLLLLLL